MNQDPVGVSTSPQYCVRHPEALATALCADCGSLICVRCLVRGDDGLSRCISCVAVDEEPDGPAPSHPIELNEDVSEPVSGLTSEVHAPPHEATEVQWIPWEDEAASRDTVAFFRTLGLAFTGPNRFMQRVPWDGGQFASPLIFAVIAGLMGQMAQTVRLLVDPQFLAGPLSAMPAFNHLSPKALILLTLPFMPLVLTVMLLLQSWVGHALLKLIGAAQRPFPATFRVFAYAHCAAVLLWLPTIGPYAYKFFLIYLMIVGLRESHGAGLAASLLAVMPLLLLQSV